MLWVEVDWLRCVFADELAFACVELEVVLCCCALDEVKYFLASGCCAGEDDGVVCINAMLLE